MSAQLNMHASITFLNISDFVCLNYGLHVWHFLGLEEQCWGVSVSNLVY